MGDGKVLVLDGGFSSQISCHVSTTAEGDPLWSARFLQTNPEDVFHTHLDFLCAGADVISTNTYQASVEGFVKHLGVSSEEGLGLIRLAVDLAERARDTYLEDNDGTPRRNLKPLIAGSVGPYGAYLHDGSEYLGNYADKISSETMKEWHKPRIKTLLESGVDLLAMETIPCFKEAEVLINLLKEYPSAKAWLSFSCKDDKSLAHGEDFQTTVIKCWEANPKQLLALGVNCCAPKVVSNLLRGINDGREPIPLVTYPNSGEAYCPEIGWTDKDKVDSIDKYVHEWLDLDKTELKKEIDKVLSSVPGHGKLRFELRDDKFSDYLMLMRERDARYTLYHENLALELKCKELVNSSQCHQYNEEQGDPVILRIALDRCREQLSATQSKLKKMIDDYSDTVPRREYDVLENKHNELNKKLDTLKTEYEALENCYRRVVAQKKSLQEELSEIKERCRELERAGTPRPQWEICADFIAGGRDSK
ncbi:unnamed protein product [Parnassius apollo]|uniref:(apollo) hypothetical protein n=1 Tax=Parnassius apollo TaxID=110799 RepID=A0A8S3Y582_PARAO|nr:unnamed protein product [Parnassius apollo]